MRTTRDELNELFDESLEAWRPDGDVRRELELRLKSLEEPEVPATPSIHSARRSSFMAVALGAAATLLLMPFVPVARALSLEELQQRVEEAPWLKLVFDDGEVKWISTTHNLSARVGEDGYRCFVDNASGDRWSHFPNSSTIRRDEVGRYDRGPTVWAAVVGPLGRAADAQEGQPSAGRWEVERHEVTESGKDLVRFDRHFRNALGERELIGRVWADPSTRRPVRIERRRAQEPGEDPADGWVSASCTFPATGPRSIFDLGLSTELLVVTASPDPAPSEVLSVLDAADAARRRFPEAFRSLSWSPGAVLEIDVLHWQGRPALSAYAEGGFRQVHTPVRLRSERYFGDAGTPEVAEELWAWTAKQAPVSVQLWDGERSFAQSGPLPEHFQNRRAPSLRVTTSSSGELSFSKNNWPTELFWPDAFRARNGDSQPLAPGADDPAGTLGVRWDRGEVQVDAFYDPSRDHLCVKRVQREREGGTWKPVSTVVLGGFEQLAGGTWVASEVTTTREGMTEVLRLEVVPLTDGDFPADVFDGEQLLEAARQAGWEIRTW